MVDSKHLEDEELKRQERELWGDEPPDSDTLRSHIYNLRRIIDRPFAEPLLQTRQGQGYCLRKATAE